MSTKFLQVICFFALAIFPASAKPLQADIVTVLFTGFLSPVAGSGMEALNFDLSDRFASDRPSLVYSGQAFQYTEREDALDYINSIQTIDYLIVIGHSFGGSSAIQLVENFLAPINIDVDLTFQIDSVDNPYGSPSDDALPDNEPPATTTTKSAPEYSNLRVRPLSKALPTLTRRYTSTIRPLPITVSTMTSDCITRFLTT